MAVMHRIRIFHAFLAITVLAAYFSAETGLIHAWLGYGVAALIAFRLIWALSGAPQLGLERFYPSFKDLHLKGIATHPAISRLLLACIALSVIGATGTGIMIDKGRSLQPASLSSLSFSAESEESEGNEESEDESGEAYEEAHELLANLAMAFVVMHVLYLLAFKRPLARFMLFANKSAK
ncbi:MAG: cytochrome b/b6 domain-containing protein [Sphingomonadales bacterium]|jgi:cytochrome b|nr:cytochrome b/b6 domain-containing protein [Sphingomonadales bacterium]